MKLLRARLPEYPQELIEPQTLAAVGCRQKVYGRVEEAAVPVEARRLVEELVGLGAYDQPAVALALGFEFDRQVDSGANRRRPGGRRVLHPG